MRILLLPSWWPSRIHPFSGIFFKEQIERLAQLHPEHQFIVLYWGHPELELRPGQFIQTLKNLFSFSSLPTPPQARPNLSFLRFPILTLPRKMFGVSLQTFFIKRILNKKFKAEKFDLVHALVGHPAGIIAKAISEKLNIPYIITEVMSPFPFPQLRTPNRSIWKPLSDAYSSAFANIADGKIKLETMKSEGFHNSRYIPNFINEEKFQIDENAGRIKPGKFNFFTLAGFVNQKGLDVLLNAIALLENRDDYHFIIGGGGPLASYLKKMAHDLGIDHLIEWHHYIDRDRALYYYQRTDAFVLPSRNESFGIVYVESLFCGTPIVATRCGGPEEFVNSDNGLLCDIDDVSGLAEIMTKMRSTRNQYQSEKIRNWAYENYSSKVVCAKVIECYQQTIHANQAK
jgi:glycosyltransferase involved in cell wall biosynthesis